MGQAAGVAVDAQDHIWVVQRPRSLTDDEKAATFNPPRTKCCKPAPPVMEFDPQGNLAPGLGRPGPGLRLAPERARHPRRPQGLRLARGERRAGRSHPQVQPRRQVRAADRQARPADEQHRHDAARAPGPHGRRSGDERGLRRRRLLQPPGHRLRRRHWRLQAPLGRLRQAADRRQAAALQPVGRAGAAVLEPGALRAHLPRTGSSTSATGRTIASRCSGRTAAS